MKVGTKDLNQKFYFVSYEEQYSMDSSKGIKNAVIDKHPLEWIKDLPETLPTRIDSYGPGEVETMVFYKIVFYAEIDQALYEKYKEQ